MVLTGDNNEFAEKQPPGEGSVGDGGQEIKTIGTIIESYYMIRTVQDDTVDMSGAIIQENLWSLGLNPNLSLHFGPAFTKCFPLWNISMKYGA